MGFYLAELGSRRSRCRLLTSGILLKIFSARRKVLFICYYFFFFFFASLSQIFFRMACDSFYSRLRAKTSKPRVSRIHFNFFLMSFSYFEFRFSFKFESEATLIDR